MLADHLQSTIALLKSNPALAWALCIVVIALFYFRPKQMGKLVLFGLFIAVVFYFILLFGDMVDTGAKQKDRMIYKSRNVIDE
jgi:predicted membrane protein